MDHCHDTYLNAGSGLAWAQSSYSRSATSRHHLLSIRRQRCIFKELSGQQTPGLLVPKNKRRKHTRATLMPGTLHIHFHFGLTSSLSAINICLPSSIVFHPSGQALPFQQLYVLFNSLFKLLCIFRSLYFCHLSIDRHTRDQRRGELPFQGTYEAMALP